MTDLHYATLLEAASAIRARKVSPVELTRTMLDRIARLDPLLHSYATVTVELALAQAKAAEVEIAAGKHRGPLHGMPIAVKDSATRPTSSRRPACRSTPHMCRTSTRPS